MNFDALIAALKTDEGFRDKPYADTVGKMTIGYGRNLEDVGISRDEAHDMVTRDAIRALQVGADLIPNWLQLDDVRMNVVANMAFNLGKGGLSGFSKFLAAVNAKDFIKAADEMRNSKWFTQVGKRAQRLAQEMQTGVVA